MVKPDLSSSFSSSSLSFPFDLSRKKSGSETKFFLPCFPAYRNDSHESKSDARQIKLRPAALHCMPNSGGGRERFQKLHKGGRRRERRRPSSFIFPRGRWEKMERKTKTTPDAAGARAYECVHISCRVRICVVAVAAAAAAAAAAVERGFLFYGPIFQCYIAGLIPGNN